jgi:GT2 family glycosyltransferase
MSDVDLSIVIVNWNSADFVMSCVRSIAAQTTGVKHEIIVVDNASFDGCDQQLAREFPDVVFLQSHDNGGFGAANNFGAQRARGSVLLFLNPDTEVLDGAISRLYRHLGAVSDAGVLGCRLLNTDGSLQTSCVQALPTVWNQMLDADILRRCFPRADFWGTRALLGRAGVPEEVQAVSGACMMMRRDVFEAAGGFSPVFFMYGEDLDLCDRVRHTGLRNHYAGDCEIVHHGGGSTQHVRSTFSVVMMRESVTLLLRRSQGRMAGTAYRVALVVMACVRLVLLAVIFPAWLIRHSWRSWCSSFRKWAAILGWGLGLDRRARLRPASAAHHSNG